LASHKNDLEEKPLDILRKVHHEMCSFTAGLYANVTGKYLGPSGIQTLNPKASTLPE
jgi:hypothetical protein